MKKRILSVLMLICLMVTMLPMTAAAGEASAPIWNPEWLTGSGGRQFQVICEMCDETQIYNMKDGYDYTVSEPVLTTLPSCMGGTAWLFEVSVKDPFKYYLDGHIKAATTDDPIKCYVTDAGGYYSLSDYTIGRYYCTPEVVKDVTLEPEGPETMPGEDTTIHALWEEVVSIEVPFSTTVKLGGDKEPGKTTFTLEEAFAKPSGDISGLTYEASVVTDGAGTYNGIMTIRGTRAELWAYLAEGAYFRMVDDGAENWTYDSFVWAVVLEQSASEASLEDSVEKEPWEVSIHPATCETLEGGEIYYTFDWEGTSVEKMSFTNTYTKNGVVQNTTIQSKSDVPKTGDTASLMLWIATFAAAAVNAAGLAVYSKKKK